MPASEDHGSHSTPVSPRGVETDSRKSSVTTLQTSQTRDSTTDPQAAANSAHAEKQLEPLAELQAVDFAQLIEHGRSLTQDPESVRQWLTEFGYLKAETDVSLRLRSNSIDPEQSGPCSLTPLLAEWITAWYKAAVDRRRADKLPRSAAFKEQADFDWLMKYTADYIRLGHEHFDQDELAGLCINITKVCQETGRENVINASIVVLHSIMTETTFPPKALPYALEVLSAGTVTLPDPLPELSDSVRLLLTGPVQEAAANWLLTCITTPTVQNNSHRLIEARGAIRQARNHLNIYNALGAFVIPPDRFLHCLNRASKCCIFRYCTEVLAACQSLLESEQLLQILDTDLRELIGTINHCTRTVLPRNSSNNSLEALRAPDRAQVVEVQRQNDKHLAERRTSMRQLLSAFERIWARLTDKQAHLVGELFMDNAKDLTDAQAEAVVSHLSKQKLLMPDMDDWSQRGTKFFDSFVRNSRISVPYRIDAARICIDAAAATLSAASVSSGSKDAMIATGKQIVDRLVNMVGKEFNTTVVRGVLLSLEDLVFCLDGSNKCPYASIIVGRLHYFVKTERELDDDLSDEHVLLFTQTIRNVFIKSLSKNGAVSVVAYEALLDIASLRCRSRRCRLAALRLLLRIRCDRDGMVFIETNPESRYIAAALCKTEESRDSYAKDLALQRSSGANAALSMHNASARHLWIYPDETICCTEWDSQPSRFTTIAGLSDPGNSVSDLNMTSWLVAVIESIQADTDWETYSYILVHLGAQLFNTKLFTTSLQAIVTLRQILCEQVHNNSFKEPPASTGLKKSDTALCFFNMLTGLIPYGTMKSEKIQKGFGDDLVRAFLTGIGNTWDGTHRGCIHALSVCSFELPASVASSYPSIVQMMGKNMSQSHLTIHILEFLAQVARLPEVHTSFNQNEITQIFGMCLQFLEKVRDPHTSSLSAPSPRSVTPARHSGLSFRRPPYRAAILQDTALPHYAAALAYHTMIFWFLSLRLDVRARYVSWIVPRLVWKNSKGEETIEEQSQVFIDMMQRTAFSDLGETACDPDFAQDSDGTISSASWIVGLSIVTVETAGHTGLTQITKRQASGTTHTVYRQLTTSTPSHHAPIHTEIRPEEIGRFGTTDMLPSHILLQMVSTAAPTSAEDQPIYLPREDYVTRALNVFDRIPTVDSHKFGVLYVGPGQTKETDYLANTQTSYDFNMFLEGLGYRVSLEPPLRYNPQGLQYPRDGDFAIAWRDRISEVVYHVPTMMPNNLEEDPSCNMKKSHVGNCHVVIVFNESGITWKLENFPSAVTFVHVIITPVNRAPGNTTTTDRTPDELPNGTASAPSTRSSEFFQVHVVTKADYPNVSPASDPKVISKDMLPAFVRMFSINANIFSQAKVSADSNDDEWPSSWRARLQAIKRLKDRVAEKTNGPPRTQATMMSVNASMINVTSGRRTPVLREDVHSGNNDTDGTLAAQLDFGSWVSPAEKD